MLDYLAFVRPKGGVLLRRYRKIGLAAALLLTLLALLPRAGAPLPVRAETMTDETRRLLENSLSIVEIDREIARIAGLREQSLAAIRQSESDLARQELAIAAQREQAGRVLRSYYMGHKDVLWKALVSTRSLPEWLRLWETMDLIVRHDRRTMEAYAAEYDQLQRGLRALQRDRDELTEVERQLTAQRERVLALQSELNAELDASGEADRLRQLMAELQAYWESVGLYEVRQHFRALATAMQAMPQWLQDHPDVLSSSGLRMTLTLTDQQMNAFLREQDRRFESFTFSFLEDKLTLDGASGQLHVRIEGRYTLEEEPVNALRFHVDRLAFNGLTLPDTTRADLEREFDLSFYPQKLVEFVKADSVKLSEGQLVVRLRLGR